MEKTSVTKATLGRLPMYLEFLKTLPEKDVKYISATVIAKNLSLGEVQVRKDLSSVSGAGKPKVGYETCELIRCIESHLGNKEIAEAVLVGAGKLGRALLQFEEFEKFGVRISAAFDSNDTLINFNEKIEILPINQLNDYCINHRIQLGIITVGAGSAQTVCDEMISGGITAIWNFAPVRLNVPSNVIVKQENLALSLAHLNSRLRNMESAN